MTKRTNLEISDVLIHPVTKTHKGLVAYISFILNNSIKINDVQILTRPNQSGFRLLYPLKEISKGHYISIVYPINKETGEQLETLLLNEYKNYLAKFGVN